MQTRPKTIVVTGASRGLGAHIAMDLAALGHRIVATSRTGVRPKNDPGLPNIQPTAMDVTDEVSVDMALAEIIDREGAIDALVCNAGIGWFAPLEVMSEIALERTIGTNLVGAIRVVRHALPALRDAGDGRVVAISSLSAVSGLPGESAYCASKAGLEAAMESLRYEVSPLGVRVAVVQPGHTADTGLVVSSRAPGTPANTVYEPLIRLNEAGCDALRRNADNPRIVCDAVRHAIEAPNPLFRYPLGSFAHLATELRGASDDEVYAAVCDVFELAEWTEGAHA